MIGAAFLMSSVSSCCEIRWRRKLRHDIGASHSSVQAVINDNFGKSGLKSAENECDFDLQAMELAEKYADKIPRFAAYFSNQWTLEWLAPMSCLSLRLTFSSRWRVHNMCLESGKQWCNAFVIAFSSSEPDSEASV
jgi:hypothetical protein